MTPRRNFRVMWIDDRVCRDDLYSLTGKTVWSAAGEQRREFAPAVMQEVTRMITLAHYLPFGLNVWRR